MPLFWLAICFTAGILFSADISGKPAFWILLACAFTLTAWIEVHFIPADKHPTRSNRLIRMPISLLLAAFALGGWRLQVAIPHFNENDLAYYQPAKEVTLNGVISSYPELSPSATRAIVEAQEIFINGQRIAVKGKLELRLPRGFALAYGDQLRLKGELRPAFSSGEPIFSSYLAQRRIFSRMSYPAVERISSGQGQKPTALTYQLRKRAYDLLSHSLPYRESSLLSGILLGIDWTIPKYLKDAYRATGTVHIIAISGFNITLIAWQVIRLFRMFFRPLMASILAIAAVIFYTLLVGADPAVVRAAVMGSLAIPAFFIGRRVIGIHSLSITAAVMLLINPFLLWDIGFRLSFLATLALMVLADPLTEWATAQIGRFKGEKAASQLQPLLMLLIPTLCAQFAVSPVLFQIDSAIQLYSLPANLLILPLQPLLMTLNGAGVLIGLLIPPLGSLLLNLSLPLATFCNEIALRFALLPKASLETPQAGSIISSIVVFFVLSYASMIQIRRVRHSE